VSDRLSCLTGAPLVDGGAMLHDPGAALAF